MTQEMSREEEVMLLLQGLEDKVTAKISPFGVEIFDKVISLEDFSKALSEATFEENTPSSSQHLPAYRSPSKVLPSNILKYNGNNSSTTISMYFPETHADIAFLEDGNRTAMRIVVPNVIVTCNYRKVEGSDNDWVQSGEARYFCSNRNLSDLKKLDFIYESMPKEGIWVLPLPNVYTVGKLCVGSANEGLLPTSICNGDFSRISYNYHFMLEAPFNQDLSIPEVSRTEFPVKRWLRFLEEIAGEGGRFPYDRLTK